MPYKNMIHGIYLIKCLSNNKCYIGSSSRVKQRLTIHKSLLRGNKHFNTYLQNAWNKYGEDNFEFKILEEVNKDKLLMIEKDFIIKYNCLIPNGFNIAEDTTAPMTGRKHKEESKNKMSENRRGEANGMFGKNHSDESRKSMSENQKKNITKERRKELSKAASSRIGSLNPFYGKTHSEETRSKISKARQNLLTQEEVKDIKFLLAEGICSHQVIANSYAVSRTCIRNIARGNIYN